MHRRRQLSLADLVAVDVERRTGPLRHGPKTVQALSVRARAMAMAAVKIPALLNDSITGSSTRPSRWIASRRGW